jgi:drug/metabolite transporter (DMT)-like permease
MTTQNSTRSGLPERSILVAFLLFIVVGGGASVAIRVTYAEMAPFWAAASRFVLGALALWTIAFLRRIPLPKGRALVGALLFGTLTVGLAFLLISWGLVATPASRYQILMATVPLLTIFLSSLHGIEAISRRGVFGSLLAVGGIAFTFAGPTASELSLPHTGAILVAAVFIAEGGVLIKKFPPNPPVMTNAIGMSVGGFILGIASLVSGEEWTIPTQTNTWIAFLYLVIVRARQVVGLRNILRIRVGATRHYRCGFNRGRGGNHIELPGGRRTGAGRCACRCTAAFNDQARNR